MECVFRWPQRNEGRREDGGRAAMRLANLPAAFLFASFLREFMYNFSISFHPLNKPPLPPSCLLHFHAVSISTVRFSVPDVTQFPYLACLPSTPALALNAILPRMCVLFQFIYDCPACRVAQDGEGAIGRRWKIENRQLTFPRPRHGGLDCGVLAGCYIDSKHAHMT